jgi:hypothetical protein
MFQSLRCRIRGHIFVDSRALPGMQTCIRCRVRQPFESLKLAASAEGPAPLDRSDA